MKVKEVIEHLKQYIVTYRDGSDIGICHLDKNVYWEPRLITTDKEEADNFVKEMSKLFPDVVYETKEIL